MATQHERHAQRALKKVQAAHAGVERAREREREASDRFVLAISDARAAGLTLHEIGEGVGLSFQRIAQLSTPRKDEEVAS